MNDYSCTFMEIVIDSHQMVSDGMFLLLLALTQFACYCSFHGIGIADLRRFDFGQAASNEQIKKKRYTPC